jgi:gliding motility-associated transport system permease protein
MTALGNIWALVRKEWTHYFGSPIAYVALFVWSMLFGVFFYVYFSLFVRQSMMGAQQMEFGGGPKMSLNELFIRPLFQNMAVVALFVAPMITMRLFAEEKRQGTIELLSTAPLTVLQIVLGKFVAAVGLYGMMLLAGLLDVVVLWHYASVNPEWKPVATGVAALLLVGGAFISLGLFLSTLTKNQIVAGIMTFALALVFWILSWLDQPTNEGFTKVLSYLSITNHLSDLMLGVIDLKDVVFYLSFISFGLFLAHQSVESQRWRA